MKQIKVTDFGIDTYRYLLYACAVCNHYYHCKGSGLHLYDKPESKLMRCLYKMAKEAEECPKDEGRWTKDEGRRTNNLKPTTEDGQTAGRRTRDEGRINW